MEAATTRQNKTCVFAGVIDVPIKTFTDAYTPSEGSWLFARTLTPIQYSAYGDLDKGINTGLYGGIFDRENIFTTFAYGEKGPFRDDTYTLPNYVQRSLRGFIQPPGTDNFPVWYNLPITLGSNKVADLQSTVVNQTSNRTPASRCLASFLGANDIVYTSQQEVPTLSTKFAFQLTANLQAARMLFQFPDQQIFNTDFGILCPDKANTNWCLIGGTVIPAPPNLAQVFFENERVFYYDVTWDNADVNTLLNFNQNFSRANPTPFGWTYLDVAATATVQGKTYGPGLLILTSPDASQWWLLNVIPTDANATNWNFITGTASAVIFPTGEVLIHHNRYDNIVLISATLGTLTNYFKNLPVFPPVDLPKPPADTEGQLFPYRETNAQS